MEQNINSNHKSLNASSFLSNDMPIELAEPDKILFAKAILKPIPVSDRAIADTKWYLNVTLQQEFNRLSRQWKNETAHLSSIGNKINHPNYLAIVAMGNAAIPMIIQSLKTEPDHWFFALSTITGQNPVTHGASFNDSVSCWLAWGDQYSVD